MSGTRYVDFKIKKLYKFNSRIEHQQDKLLKKLKKKEKHFEHKIKNTDSLAYARFKKQPLSYDSISKVSKTDTGTNAAKFSKKKNGTIDSLKGVESFVQNKSGLASNAPDAQGKTTELNSMQGKLNFRNYITQLITERTNNLKNLQGSEGNVPGLKGIQKQVFYGKAKMKAFKAMEEDPSKVEDKAMEYLQGTDGFDKSMKNATQGGGESMQSVAASGGDASQLEKMGYQTRQQVQGNLMQKFGGNLGNVSKQISSQVTQFQQMQKELSSAKETKQSLTKVTNTEKPAFKVNPMRGLPFRKRIEKQYSWQTPRPSADGTQPAIVTPSVMFGFKHTPKLMYGLGAASSFGLGQSWQNVHLSFQGIGLRSFTTWKWQYGIGAYAGYERMYKQFVFTNNAQNTATDVPNNPHSTSDYNESLLVGLTKSYKMNSKYNGAIQVLYDIWWEQKGLKNPIVLRFATMTK